MRLRDVEGGLRDAGAGFWLQKLGAIWFLELEKKNNIFCLSPSKKSVYRYQANHIFSSKNKRLWFKKIQALVNFKIFKK